MMIRAVKLGALAALVLVAILPAIASAADVTTIMQPAHNSCGLWVARRNNSGQRRPDLWEAEGWVTGFLSGMAVHSSTDFLKGLDPDAVYGWLDNYCRAHPLDPLSTALIHLSGERGVKPSRNVGYERKNEN